MTIPPREKRKYLQSAKKGLSIKLTKQLINKILITINAFPKFEEVLFNSIMAGDTEQEVITYAEVLGASDPKQTGKKWFRDFYGGERSHIYWRDRSVGFRTNIPKFLIPSKLQILIKDCIQEAKERKPIIKEYRETGGTKPQIQQETRVFTYLLHNPKAMEELNALQIAKITNASENIVQQIIDGEIVPAGTKSQEKLMDVNYKIIEKGKQKVLKSIDSLDAEKFQDLKALSDILDTAFKQNRLLEGKSTENALVGVTDIYEAVIGNADAQKKESY